MSFTQKKTESGLKLKVLNERCEPVVTHQWFSLTGLDRAAEPVPHKETLWLEVD